MPTGELSVGRQGRSPLDDNGPKTESPLVSPVLPLLALVPVPPRGVTALEGAGVAEALVLLTGAAAATGAG